ncbi:MAG: formate C-acetyltransferase/glycerol dehydratase family glycyl radical enzyme [Bacteroidales bacterium]
MPPGPSNRVIKLRDKVLSCKRYLSVEQAVLITSVYRLHEGKPVPIIRALALSEALQRIAISIDPDELIVGNRTSAIRAGVVFPEAGISWLSREIDTIDSREQDTFFVRQADKDVFRTVIEPYWRGRTLEDHIYSEIGEELLSLEKVVKINQKDHAQGHICPDVGKWLKLGISGLLNEVRERGKESKNDLFYDSVKIVLEGASVFIKRYSDLAFEMSAAVNDEEQARSLKYIGKICKNLAMSPPATFREAIQSLWFLFVILHMESNASSFSPGRMDQYLLPYYRADILSGLITRDEALELIDNLYIKFNQVVYMRNAHSARYFAGFPIGFNVTIGGIMENGSDATNELSFLMLEAQGHCRLPQPNLTARVHQGSKLEFLKACSEIISLGTGMPQLANDSSIIPALVHAGLEEAHAKDYTLVGCVELSGSGNYLGWSDAAMFNMVKALELAINNGKCMLTGKMLGPETGEFSKFSSFSDFENAFLNVLKHFAGRMIDACRVVEKYHAELMPSPFLSAVVDDCIEKGIDVTAGGARYNHSGIQAIQIANVADSLAVIKKLVYDDSVIDRHRFPAILESNFESEEYLRQYCINRVEKYGNDVEWVDGIGARWIRVFHKILSGFVNPRGGPYIMGLYTVSAHVPMGSNVGATPDGRKATKPLADGGLSPMYGRDRLGPTAVLNSVSRIPSIIAANGSLLNMKFMPAMFNSEENIERFSSLIRSFSGLPLHHVQFNVLNDNDLREARLNPELYRDLTVRVAGYTAYFTELAPDLQQEIIDRTTHGN